MEQIMAFLPFIVLIALFYLMIFLPEKKRKKQYTAMIEELKVNDNIMTKGGILGKVITIKDDYIIVESGPDRARLKFTKNAIATVNSTAEVVEE